MAKHAALLLAPGFEEAEAIIILDILERLGIKITTLSCDNSKNTASYHDVSIHADMLLSQTFGHVYDAIIIPGGPQGTLNLCDNPMVIRFIDNHDRAGKLICPICSAAAKVLAPHGFLRGRNYVFSGTFFEGITDGVYINAPVVRDGNLISGQGLGVAFDFAFNIALILTDDHERVYRQEKHIYYRFTLAEEK
ncbi:DJ-1/PfpI family protein [Serratia proteamaculans]